LLGLGYAVYLALEQTGDSDVLVLLGDTIITTDLPAFVKAGPNVIGLHAVDDPERFGIADIEGGRITRVEEKPANATSNMAIVGLYYFSETKELKAQLHTLIEKDHTTRGEYQITDALQAMIAKGHTLAPYEIDGWYDCGQKETLLATNRALLSKAPSAMGIAGSVLIPPVYVAPDATVDQAIVGPYVSIGAGAVVRDCIVRNSIVSAGAQVSEILLEGSLIGTATEIKGHFKKFNVGDNSEVADL